MRARVAFLGSPEFAVPSLRAVAVRHAVPLVVTQPDRPAGRGRRLEPTAVRRAAAELGLEAIAWERGQRPALEQRLAALDLDALVVVAFGRILKPSTLAVPRHGAVNLHASLLPRWRGVAPVERALLAGDASTGVTIMQIDAGVDTGPLLAQRAVAIGPEDTRVSLAARLAQIGAELLVASLEAFLAGRLRPEPQPEQGVTYAPRLEKTEGELDWRRGAVELWNRVRGLYDWPGAFTRLGETVLKVHSALPHEHSARGEPGLVVEADPRRGVEVACGDGTLELLEVQLPGKPRVAARDLVRGRVLRPGLRLGA